MYQSYLIHPTQAERVVNGICEGYYKVHRRTYNYQQHIYSNMIFVQIMTDHESRTSHRFFVSPEFDLQHRRFSQSPSKTMYSFRSWGKHAVIMVRIGYSPAKFEKSVNYFVSGRISPDLGL